MARRRDEEDDDIEQEEDYYEDREVLDDEEEEDLEEEEEEEEEDRRGGKKRRRSQFIDDVAEEDDDEEDDDDEDYGRRGRRKQKSKRRSASDYFDIEAVVDSDGEEEEEEGEEDFIDNANDLPDEDDNRQIHRRPLLPREEEDVDDLERRIQERYRKSVHIDYDEETTDVDQQALLPSVRDPKLWMVKCAIGHEREAAVCLMQKCIDRGPELQIRSVIALDHLKNFIYVEADKEAHVREACKGLRSIYNSQKVMLVPINEMTDVLSVESKAIDISRDTWVRMKTGTYKGDLAKVVEVDNVKQRVTVKLIPRIDLQAIANKLENRETPKKKSFVPPPRFLNVDEARELNIRVERRRDPMTGDYFETIDNMKFKDGFLYKIVSMKSISSHNIKPTFDEMEKFRQPSENGDGDLGGLSTLFANRKKGHFMKGDAVIVVKGDLKNLKGWVEKVEEENVYIRPEMKDLPRTLAVNQKELCKYFEPGNHVKVVSGTQEGATDDVVESSEVTSGINKIGDYELHDLVFLDDTNFGVIIRVETEAFQVLKGVPDRPEVITVRLREIKSKIDRKFSAQDKWKNMISVKDVVRVLDGPCQGKTGPVEHIFKGVVFIFDRHHREHAGFICAKAFSCVVIGGSRANNDRHGDSRSRLANFRQSNIPPSPRKHSRGGPLNYGGRHGGGRGHNDPFINTRVRITQGPFKGYCGRVKEIKGTSARVELESQMREVQVDRSKLSEIVVSTPHRESRYGVGSETPMHPSRTPLHPFMTPMRDPGATPIHDGMRTPMRDRAWLPMSPPRDDYEDGNPASWGTSPHYQPGSPPSRTYEAPTPGSGWASTPSGSYSEAGTPRDVSSAYVNAPSPYLPSTPGQPMTPGAASYLPGTPGGQPMTPGTGGVDGEGPWYMPDILVNVVRPGDESATGVIRDVLPDGTCRVALGPTGNGEMITVLPSEIEMVVPGKSDKVRIMGGSLRGQNGKLMGVDANDCIVRLEENLDIKILDLGILAKLP
ncbi:hypothetical protein CDL15_Pgr027860 [Punica granatum]|uniref:Transcription elongation factor SPT5 n=1 Tax=Punica granatum TaxID=22663 RepID=A0A218XJD2_PUNGR|nr:hypothetical protein CDL15_Pgr027860 [Punica granatum]